MNMFYVSEKFTLIYKCSYNIDGINHLCDNEYFKSLSQQCIVCPVPICILRTNLKFKATFSADCSVCLIVIYCLAKHFDLSSKNGF